MSQTKVHFSTTVLFLLPERNKGILWGIGAWKLHGEKKIARSWIFALSLLKIENVFFWSVSSC